MRAAGCVIDARPSKVGELHFADAKKLIFNIDKSPVD